VPGAGGPGLFTSSGGMSRIAGSIAYTIAKSAVVGLTKALNLEARPEGIRVNAVLSSARTRMSVGTPGTAPSPSPTAGGGLGETY
jgi:NAD(P)-dependent dehydrogenase (short-subunit alcohol dehydrogenase family)